MSVAADGCTMERLLFAQLLNVRSDGLQVDAIALVFQRRYTGLQRCDLIG